MAPLATIGAMGDANNLPSSRRLVWFISVAMVVSGVFNIVWSWCRVDKDEECYCQLLNIPGLYIRFKGFAKVYSYMIPASMRSLTSCKQSKEWLTNGFLNT